jgi:hypothetical protein
MLAVVAEVLIQEVLLAQVALVAVVTAQIQLMALLDQSIQAVVEVAVVIHQAQDHLMVAMAVAV